MSQDNDRTKVIRLAEAFMQDILAAPEEEIVAEIDFTSITRARAIVIEAKRDVASKLLRKAKTELDAWKSAKSPGGTAFDRASIREKFEKIRRSDPEFNRKVTLAARNGKPPTEADVGGLVEDWTDLRRLDEDVPE